MLAQRLGLKTVPTSIFKLTNEDEDSTQRLRSLIIDILKPPVANNPFNNNLKNSENSCYGGLNNNVNEKTNANC